ncbi:B12-binding domain-containing radical SAM protein [Candidatus Omnitrophota bacterium]
MNSLTLIQFTYNRFAIPLGALYLAYGLEKANIQFDLKICPVYSKLGVCTKADIDKLYSYLLNSRDIVAIGCWSDALPVVLVALAKIKRKFPGKMIILGGLAPAEFAEEIMGKFPFIDFVIKGCGTASLPALVKKIIKQEKIFNDIEGLVYRSGRHIISNNYDRFYSNSIIPDIFPYDRSKNIGSYRVFYIRTSFGCSYRCTFCQLPCLSRGGVAYRDINDVIQEIKLIKKIKKSKRFMIDIIDEAFILNRARVIKFCKLLRRENLNPGWHCYGRIDRVDKELLKIMSESGCQGIYFGVESGSNRILRKIKKGFTIEKAIEILLLSKRYIKGVAVSFMYLFPFETLNDFRETLFFKKYLNLNKLVVQLHQLNPVKNSEIYSKYKGKLCLFPKKDSSFHVNLEHMPKECIKLIRDNPEIFSFYYLYKFVNLNEILRYKKNEEDIRKLTLSNKNCGVI